MRTAPCPFVTNGHGLNLAAARDGVRTMNECHRGCMKPPVSHPLFARAYACSTPAMDRAGAAEHRRRLLMRLTGRVIEVGAGDGANFDHYPAEVTSVLAVEPEQYLRGRAQQRAARAPVPIEVVDGVAEQLPVSNQDFDAAVVSLVLCSVTDQDQALRELHRVLASGGQLRFFEHVRAESLVLRRVQRLLDATVWPSIAGGCHTGRDTAATIGRAGFRIDRLHHFRFPDVGLSLPTSPHILGAASRVSPVRETG